MMQCPFQFSLESLLETTSIVKVYSEISMPCRIIYKYGMNEETECSFKEPQEKSFKTQIFAD